MEIGNKILELRKQHNLSQENLAEKMNVARQTISKWELGETSPDLNQAKELSKIFNVSLDDLTNNDIKNIIINKISNTEKLTKIIINILKIICLFIIILIIVLIATIYFREYFEAKPAKNIQSINCTIDDKTYTYEGHININPPYTVEFYTNDKEINIDTTKYNNLEWLFNDIKEYVTSHNGTCN